MVTASLNRGLTRFNVWIALLAVITAVAFSAIIIGFLEGHEVTFNTSTGVPWGLLISSYLFFVLPASGLCLLSSLGHVFGVERFKPMAKQAILLAIVLLLSGFFVIASDLESPWRMAIYLFLTPNPTSAMWWMGTLYAVYFVVLLVEFFFLCRSEAIQRLREGPAPRLYRLLAIGADISRDQSLLTSKRVAKLSGTVAVVLAVAALSTLGAVFGFQGSRTIWHGAFLPVYFILSAYVSGTAVLIPALMIGHGGGTQPFGGGSSVTVRSLARLLLVLLAGLMVFMVWNVIVAQYGQIPGAYDAVMVLVSGPLAVPFWIGEVVIGMLAPIAILVYTGGRQTWGLVAAPLMVIIGMFVARYDFVLAGQLVPVIGREAFWQYSPSVVEMMTVLGALSLCLLLYSVGNRLFPLEDSPISSRAR
jgi:molybdopterin-containing oxidoreductase family membrane subunit